MNSIRLLGLASLSIVALNCTKQTEATPCEGTSTTVAAQVFTLPATCSLAALRGEKKTYVINSLTELGIATQCGSSVVAGVDFTRYTILAGRVPMPAGAVLRTQVVEKNCQDTYTYTVGIAEGVTQSPTDVDHAVLVPKLPGAATVNFVVVKAQ